MHCLFTYGHWLYAHWWNNNDRAKWGNGGVFFCFFWKLFLSPAAWRKGDIVKSFSFKSLAWPTVKFAVCKKIFYFVCSGCCLCHCWECGCAADVVSIVNLRRNVEFSQRTSGRSPTLREICQWIFNVHQLMLWEGMPIWMFMWRTAHTLIPFPICETPRQFIAALGFKPKLDNSGASVPTSRPHCQPTWGEQTGCKNPTMIR